MTVSEAKKVKRLLVEICNEAIKNHPDVKAAIKAKKAVVTGAANTSAHTVTIAFVDDIISNGGVDGAKSITLPYNPKLPTSALAVGNAVSVWYSYGLQNAIVMEDAAWTAR